MLNIPRVNLRGAVAHMQGAKFARGGQLPFALFDAVALSEEEAAELQLDVNAKRMIDEARREFMQG